MKRFLEALPLALAAVWFLTSVTVLALYVPERASPRAQTAAQVVVAEVALSAGSSVVGVEEPARPPTEITLPTVVIAAPAPRAAAAGTARQALSQLPQLPRRAWRCSGWRALASGPEDQAVRYCE